MAANRVRMLLLGMALLCSSCAPQAGPPAPKLYKGPLVYKPLTAELLDLSSVGFQLPAYDNSPSLLFCTTTYEEAGITHRPSILRRTVVGWEMMDFDFEPFAEGCEWLGVYASRDNRKIWAIACWTMEDPGTSLEIVYSGDAGQTWQHIASVEKVWYLVAFDSFRMDSGGHGLISTRLSDGEITTLAGGYYVYRTCDWGKTWSGPIFVDDILADTDSRPPGEPASTIIERLSKKDP